MQSRTAQQTTTTTTTTTRSNKEPQEEDQLVQVVVLETPEVETNAPPINNIRNKSSEISSSSSSNNDRKQSSANDRNIWPAEQSELDSSISQNDRNNNTKTTEITSSNNQRIKVTLSAPRSSSDFQAEPILVQDQSQTTPTLSNSPTTTSTSTATNSTTTIRRRQSTSTLISASGRGGEELEQCNNNNSAANNNNNSSSSDNNSNNNNNNNNCSTPIVRQLNREEQEKELRRIASERNRKRQHQQHEPLDRGKSNPFDSLLSKNSSSPLASNNNNNKQTNSLTRNRENSRQVVQQQQLTYDSSANNNNPKQLAIYINGKIRSNSIFCRSSSSNSFNSILNRFHTNNNNNNNETFKSTVVDVNKIEQQQQQQQQQLQLPANSIGETSGQVEEGKNIKNSKRNRNKKKRRSKFNRREDEEKSSRENKIKLLEGFQRLIANYLPRGELGKSSNLSKQNSSSSSSLGSSSKKKKKRKRRFAKRVCKAPLIFEVNNKLEEEEEEGEEPEEEEATPTKASYKLNPSSMFLRKAMRYYRLWIYCTNFTILLGTLIFFFSLIHVLSDYRIRLIVTSEDPSSSTTLTNQGYLEEINNNNSFLVNNNEQQQLTSKRQSHLNSKSRNFQDQEPPPSPSSSTNPKVKRGGDDEFNFHISYTEPYVILGYVAIAIQAGILQAIGCFGAINMKERWIQAFYYLILLLILFDVVFLLYWLNRYDFISQSLRRHMTKSLGEHYGRLGGRSVNYTTSYYHQYKFDKEALENRNNELSGGDDSTAAAKMNSPLPNEFSSKFDKIITEIIDKIQTDSRCCGISSSLDYKRSRWRQIKLEQLSSRLMINNNNNNNNNNTELTNKSADLLRRVPLVPASCCRVVPSGSSSNNVPVIFDDSQQSASKPITRIPAWSPSMVVENLQHPQHYRMRSKLATMKAKSSGSSEDDDDDYDSISDSNLLDSKAADETEAADGVEEANDRLSFNNDNLSNQQRRWLAKEENFKRRQYTTSAVTTAATTTTTADNDAGRDSSYSGSKEESLVAARRKRRWLIESSVDNNEQVLSRLVELDDEDDHYDMNGSPWFPAEVAGDDDAGEANDKLEDKVEEATQLSATSSVDKLASFREILFDGSGGDNDDDNYKYSLEHFKWPNKLRLNFEQYKLIEGFLIESSSSSTSANDDEEAKVNGRKQRRSVKSLNEEDSLVASSSDDDDDDKDNIDNNSKGKRSTTTHHADQMLKTQAQEENKRLREEIAELLRLDPETSCAPKSYLDQQSIYTHGCQPFIKSWLDSSAHILFVTGFCVLTLLKFCSVLLLRLEIREMIHKIRVLKGMATEYNALHDLEAYLPRPSVCAQAAELTSCGVVPADPAAAAACANLTNSSSGGLEKGAGQSAQPHPSPYRLGGSFSEAVAAATAAAICNNNNSQTSACPAGHPQLNFPNNVGRAASMKTMAMLKPNNSNQLGNLCTRSSSATNSAHLCSALLGGGGGGGGGGAKLGTSLRHSTDIFTQASNLMSRRHTAISVCPTAAAVAAAAAAQQLMSHSTSARRGTYYAHPLNLSGFNLNQHRHSAAVPLDYQFLLNPTSAQQQAPRAQSFSLGHQEDQNPEAGSCCSTTATTTLQAQQQQQQRTLNNNNKFEHQSSGDSSKSHQSSQVAAGGHGNQAGKQQQRARTTTAATLSAQASNERHSSGDSQLLSLVYPFKRQSSGGAQSAGNFSLDLSPSLLAESRRSIH